MRYYHLSDQPTSHWFPIQPATNISRLRTSQKLTPWLHLPFQCALKFLLHNYITFIPLRFRCWPCACGLPVESIGYSTCPIVVLVLFSPHMFIRPNSSRCPAYFRTFQICIRFFGTQSTDDNIHQNFSLCRESFPLPELFWGFIL
jgi:hypothetical protein